MVQPKVVRLEQNNELVHKNERFIEDLIESYDKKIAEEESERDNIINRVRYKISSAQAVYYQNLTADR